MLQRVFSSKSNLIQKSYDRNKGAFTLDWSGPRESRVAPPRGQRHGTNSPNDDRII